jgi:hypothetical protein
METTPEQAAEGLAIVKVLAAVLERLVCTNATLARTDPGQVTKFHALKAPGIGIQAYLERVHKYASCSNECFILALIYIDRLIQRNNFLLTELNVHRVVITAILLAAKFFDDAYYNNAYYSNVGGVLVSEMNGLEVDFLFRINFSLHVTPEVFEKYKAELVAHSLNTGVAIPQVPAPKPQIADASYLNGTTLDQWVPMEEVSSASIPMPALSSHLVPPHVTPSPSHALAAPLVEPRRATPNAFTHPPYVAEQLYTNGIPQQILQRANSLPPPYPTHTGRCLDDNPNLSAPMVSMLPGGTDDQYVVMGNQVFPLQTTLVHHHHGVENYQEQPAFHHQQHGGNGYPLTRESFGSLAVAGHY